MPWVEASRSAYACLGSVTSEAHCLNGTGLLCPGTCAGCLGCLSLGSAISDDMHLLTSPVGSDSRATALTTDSRKSNHFSHLELGKEGGWNGWKEMQPRPLNMQQTRFLVLANAGQRIIPFSHS